MRTIKPWCLLSRGIHNNTGKQATTEQCDKQYNRVRTESMIIQEKQSYTMIGIGQGGHLEELTSKPTPDEKRIMGRGDLARGIQREMAWS